MEIEAQIADTPVFILCGGLGTRIKEDTEFRPKPMVPIGHRPILWHVMQRYSKYGFKKFVLCLGFKAEAIKSYFLNYTPLSSDFTVDLKSNNVSFHSTDHNDDWQVTLAYTGETAMTGARIARAATQYLGDSQHLAVTYGDGLANVNLAQQYQYHLSHKKMGTVLGVNPPSRFGELKLDGDLVTEFEEKPEFNKQWINGGFFFFNRSFVSDYLTTQENCILERQPLIDLAKAKELNLYKHHGFWACMDTQRDRDHLEALWQSGNAPWTTEEQVFSTVN